jgi:hypothetical protein
MYGFEEPEEEKELNSTLPGAKCLHVNLNQESAPRTESQAHTHTPGIKQKPRGPQETNNENQRKFVASTQEDCKPYLHCEICQ